MLRDLILGTAGHIDHGKTSLVRALTGVDCDRLPEEKARGITIDIGFAHLPLGELRLGIVDVPGHERFIRNMLAGSTGIDLALLVVAADDSVMPQTREHLDILKLLGLEQGVVAITKCDQADDTTREVVALEVQELVQGTFLEAAPVVFTSASTGEGLEELKAALTKAANRAPRSRCQANSAFRMAIDRAFVVQGHGTVVTGSVASGSAKAGDTLDWHVGDGTVEPVRIRGLNRHGESVDEVHRGQRAAINLAGVPHERVRRGQDLAAPGVLVPSRVLTVQLTATSRTIKHRLPVRVHVGTAEILGSVSMLNDDRLKPGESEFAQLFLESPATTVWGQPFVVRDSSAEHTLGGGTVLQPVATKLRRRHSETLARIEQLASTDSETRLLAAAWFAGLAGVNECDPRFKVVGRRSIHPDRWADLCVRVMTVLAELHAAHPLLTTIDRTKLLARFEYLGDSELVLAAVTELLATKKLVGDPRQFARADFKPKLNANQLKLKDQIVAAHAAAGCQPPDLKSFASPATKDIYAVAEAEGWLVRITDEVWLHARAEADMLAKVRAFLAGGRTATVAEIRDLLGTTRKFAVPLCEHLDRIGITLRTGDLRGLADRGKS
ncbi:MAG: selenocysteine-specific translation elongation factor [Gemmataceae bacterium]